MLVSRTVANRTCNIRVKYNRYKCVLTFAKMDRGEKVVPSVKYKLVLKLNEDCSFRKRKQLDETVNRSRKVIMNLLKDPDNYGKEKQTCYNKLDFVARCRKS